MFPRFHFKIEKLRCSIVIDPPCILLLQVTNKTWLILKQPVMVPRSPKSHTFDKRCHNDSEGVEKIPYKQPDIQEKVGFHARYL